MSDLQKYINQRSQRDPEFTEEFERGYEEFRCRAIEVVGDEGQTSTADSNNTSADDSLQSLMSKLQQVKIDATADFAANFNSYTSSDKNDQ